jgi:hypothetical protein
MSDTSKPDALRLMLMSIGGMFTVTMAKNGLTPDKVAAASDNYIAEDELAKIMNGSNVDVPNSKLAYIAGQLGLDFLVVVSPKSSGTPAG